jgi:Na+/melibiose symporter-like transporter
MAKKSEKTETLEIRKAPKFLPFMLTGTIFGAILGILLYTLIPAENRTGQDVFGYLVIFMMAVGFAGGTFMAVIFDWVSRAQIKQVEATKLKG